MDDELLYVRYDAVAESLGVVAEGQSGAVLRDCLRHLGIEPESFRAEGQDQLEEFLLVEEARRLARTYRRLATVSPVGEIELHEGPGWITELTTYRRDTGDA